MNHNYAPNGYGAPPTAGGLGARGSYNLLGTPPGGLGVPTESPNTFGDRVISSWQLRQDRQDQQFDDLLNTQGNSGLGTGEFGADGHGQRVNMTVAEKIRLQELELATQKERRAAEVCLTSLTCLLLLTAPVLTGRPLSEPRTAKCQDSRSHFELFRDDTRLFALCCRRRAWLLRSSSTGSVRPPAPAGPKRWRWAQATRCAKTSWASWLRRWPTSRMTPPTVPSLTWVRY